MKIFKEFRDFAMRGNVIDMAVGIIIGVAFGRVVSSFVADVLMPPIGLLVGGVDFTNLKVLLKPAVMEGGRILTPAVTINYGTFIQVVIDFLIIAFAVFMMIKGLNSFYKQKPKPTVLTTDQTLLTEIRDLLKTNNKVKVQ
jgi:large conductance mechanosensitive channel